MSSHSNKIRRLALSIATGTWDIDALQERVSRALAGGPPDPRRLANRLVSEFDEDLPPPISALITFLSGDDPLRQAFKNTHGRLVPSILLDPPVMGPLPEQLSAVTLPALATWKDLRLWLGLFDGELAWFADREGRQNKSLQSKLHHYRYRWIAKRSGRHRLLEIPKARLKSIQRQVLVEILNHVPPHPSAHGFRRNFSCLSYVAPHVGKETILRMDIKDFFHSVPSARIGGVFRRLGYPWAVAEVLRGLCTHATSGPLAGAPYKELSREARERLRFKHLPQGAPTSPAIANLCAWRLDRRLQSVSERFGLDYTRYADDLAFSGSSDLLRLAPFLQGLVGAIALEEGFHINHRKTRLNSQAQRQRLAGIVVNQKPNPPRREYDLLRATLYNCIRFGPDSQNRRQLRDYKSHLAGRLAYVAWLNPCKGERLRALWTRIRWPA